MGLGNDGLVELYKEKICQLKPRKKGYSFLQKHDFEAIEITEAGSLGLGDELLGGAGLSPFFLQFELLDGLSNHFKGI